ncbi:MAG: V-type ATPase subunit, partial [Synergistaceae bacterium]|nr:V-type ATPase subunit [Synergistaceae bacterium]
MSRNEAYGYAVARIRAMEPLLLDASQLQRMMDADGVEGALKVLSETSYARWFSGGDGRYDAALEEELSATFSEFASFVPDGVLIDIFRAPYDFHNVKVIMKGGFKARSGGRKRYDLLTGLGSMPADGLAAKIEGEEYALLPYGLSRIIPACAAVWEQSRDIVEIERLLDREMFSAILSLAESVGSPGITRWVRARIDSENIRNLVRIKRFGFDAAAAVTFLHDGGSIAPSVLVSLMQEQFDGWGRALAYSSVGLAISAIQSDGGFDSLIVALETALDDYCSSVLSDARYSPDAPENVPAYLWGKEMEVKNIRTILVS